MDSTKKRPRRSRSFLCFRPEVIDDGSVKSYRKTGSGKPVLKCIGVGEKESMVIPKLLPSPSLSEEKTKLSDGDLAAGKDRSRRSFSRILKAVLFETSLAKKVRKRKARKKLKSQSDLQQRINNKEPEFDSDRRFNSSRSSSGYSFYNINSNSLSSSCVSSLTSNSTSRSNSMESKQVYRQISRKRECKLYGSNIGLCLLLFSLLVLIFWGRVCAILCTSTWLLFAPSRRFESPVTGVDFPAMLWEEHKKRIIMEGLLERNRSRVLL